MELQSIRSVRSATSIVVVLGLCILVGGCKPIDLPDPNNPKNLTADGVAKLLHSEIQSTADDLNARVVSGQITDAQREALLAKRASELLKEGDPNHSPPQDDWIYADLYLTEDNFSAAIPLLKQGIDYAETVKDDDRRVNDSFRLARALAATGKIEPALDLAQKIIASKPSDPGPVLPSVLLQLTPLTEGKGHDDQLAKLLEESIHEHLLEKVDPTSEAGKAFLIARPFHIEHAWQKIIELLNKTGHPDQAAAAAVRENAMMKSLVGSPSAYVRRSVESGGQSPLDNQDADRGKRREQA
jgi:tetratricopeptide (TPR) repeat protein